MREFGMDMPRDVLYKKRVSCRSKQDIRTVADLLACRLVVQKLGGSGGSDGIGRYGEEWLSLFRGLGLEGGVLCLPIFVVEFDAPGVVLATVLMRAHFLNDFEAPLMCFHRQLLIACGP